MTIEPETLDKMVEAFWTFDGSEWAECDEEARGEIRGALVAALRVVGVHPREVSE